MEKKNIFRAAIATLVLLLLPLIAMQFTEEVNWSVSDFILMGSLLFITTLALQYVSMRAGKYRVIGMITVVVLFLWLWAELAVGVFTNLGS